MTPLRILLASLVALLVAALAIFGVGEVLSRPAARVIGSPPSDFPARIVQIDNGPAGSVRGWFAPGQRGNGVILLLHGLRTDRTHMLERARLLNRVGYATLLVDLPAHGESAGERITFGAREAAGVRASLQYLRRTLPAEPVGIIGVSLGAASIVLARSAPAPDAVILESMYPTIEEAVENRLTARLGSMGARLAPLLLWQLPLRTGVSAQELMPIHELPALGAPVLIVSGTDDKHTTWPETQRLFDAAAQPKELWQVDGAAHVDLHTFAPEEYERRILQFLSRHLNHTPTQTDSARCNTPATNDRSQPHEPETPTAPEPRPAAHRLR